MDTESFQIWASHVGEQGKGLIRHQNSQSTNIREEWIGQGRLQEKVYNRLWIYAAGIRKDKRRADPTCVPFDSISFRFM